MSEIRKDPISGRWILFSGDRTKRPGDYPSTRMEWSDLAHDPLCPFCRGNEHFTDRAIHSVEGPGGWIVRTIPNRFPALKVEGALKKTADGLYDCMDGVGAHEVVIETPRHDEMLCRLAPEHFAAVLLTYRDRLRDLRRDCRMQYVLIFKNHGIHAGQLIPHSHSQLIGLPFVPLAVQEEVQSAWRYFEFKDRYLFDDIIGQEIKDEVRIIEKTQRFVALCPYAPRFPFETWILPRSHAPHFEDEDDEAVRELAVLFKHTMMRLNRALGLPAYNFVLHNAPRNLPLHQEAHAEAYHWHFEIIPKVNRVAGFEWGSGCYVNPTQPEQAAEFLRGIQPGTMESEPTGKTP